MKIIFYLVFFVLPIFCSNNLNFKELSKLLSEIDKPSYNKDIFYRARMKLFDLDSLRLFLDSDTLFLLESDPDIQNGNMYIKIWDNKSKINFLYNEITNEFYVLEEDNIFTDFMCKLIENWDVRRIKIEEIEGFVLNAMFITGSIVIVKDNNFYVRQIMFREFFLFERDVVY